MTPPKINFNSKHLGKGDALPPWNGKLRVYSMRLCPFAERTILALNAKQIDYEVVNINLSNRPEWLVTKSPLGKVPAIEIEEGVVIYESLVTVEYIDEVFPQRPLLPKDPVRKAYHRIFIEATEPIRTLYYKYVLAPNEVQDSMIAPYHKALNFVEDILKKHDSVFLDGNVPGFADYMMWPWFERINTFDNTILEIDASKYPNLSTYIQNMLKDEVVAEYTFPKEVFQKVFSKAASRTFNIQEFEKEWLE